MIAVAPVVAQSSRNFLEMNSMLCVSGQKKIVKINPKLEKLFKIFKNKEKFAPLKKKHVHKQTQEQHETHLCTKF